MYVVSSDDDLAKACEPDTRLHHIGDLKEFIDLIRRAEDDSSGFILRLVLDNHDPVLDALKREFADRYVFLDDEDGEGEVISVDEIDLSGGVVIELSDEGAILQFDAEFEFAADITFSRTWTEFEHRRVDRSVNVPVEVHIRFEHTKLLEFTVSEVVVNGDEPVSIHVDEDAYRHWK